MCPIRACNLTCVRRWSQTWPSSSLQLSRNASVINFQLCTAGTILRIAILVLSLSLSLGLWFSLSLSVSFSAVSTALVTATVSLVSDACVDVLHAPCSLICLCSNARSGTKRNLNETFKVAEVFVTYVLNNRLRSIAQLTRRI